MKSGKIMTMPLILRVIPAANDGPLPSKAKAYKMALEFAGGNQDLINYDPELGEFYYVLYMEYENAPLKTAEFPFNPE